MDINAAYFGEMFSFQAEIYKTISRVFPRQISEEEQEIVDVPKQLADYNISAHTVRKIERKYFKNWF